MKVFLTKRLFAALVCLVFCLVAAMAYGHGHHKHEHVKKQGILLVAFGSSLPEARSAFDHIEQSVRSEFDDIPVKWAYTSEIVRHKLENSGKILNSPAQALADMADAGFTHVAVQSLHTIAGAEYHELVQAARSLEQSGIGLEKVTIGLPLLGSPEDMDRTSKAIVSVIPDERKTSEAVVLMGHGTYHPANAFYPALMWQVQLTDENIFVGTVEGFPSADTIIGQLKKKKINTAWLMPFMSVAGDHAQNDMAGKGKDSWKSLFENAGINCSIVLKGTAEYDEFVQIWVDHLKKAVSDL
jgi:sirohydrochlorin cobaltochelatase